MRKKFECYEIWRPNIPDNGCNKQCKECKEKQSINFKDMSRDKPTGWALLVVAFFFAIVFQISFNVWGIDLNGNEVTKPILIFLPQILLLLGIIIYKFTKD